MEQEIKEFLSNHGIKFIQFVDISHLGYSQNQGFPKAIIFGIPFSKEYLMKFCEDESTDKQEFKELERNTDRTADILTEFLISKGYNSISQSEQSVEDNKLFNVEKLSSALPHKTIAVLGGVGWIGKNNLLVTQKYGCAISMCSVLTDAPLLTENHDIIQSKCGNCNICKDICDADAIFGQNWCKSTGRDFLIDVDKCSTCVKCIAFCPWSIKYRCSK